MPTQKTKDATDAIQIAPDATQGGELSAADTQGQEAVQTDAQAAPDAPAPKDGDRYDELLKKFNLLQEKQQTDSENHAREMFEMREMVDATAAKAINAPPPPRQEKGQDASFAKRDRVNLEAEGYTGRFIHKDIQEKDRDGKNPHPDFVFGRRKTTDSAGSLVWELKSQRHTWKGDDKDFRLTFDAA